MAAKHKKAFYKPVEVKNPFNDSADRAYAEILQDNINEKKRWQKTFFINTFFSAVYLVLFFYALNLQRAIPMLVNVTPEGEARYIGEVRQGSFSVPEAAVHFQIRTFVHKLRSVATDYQVVYDNIDDCFQMVTADYGKIMRQALLEESPFDMVGKQRRSLEIESVLHITGSSYQINWTETVIEKQLSKLLLLLKLLKGGRSLPSA